VRGGSPFVGHQPRFSSLSGVVRLIPFSGGPCALARQDAIPANANMILGAKLLKVIIPFSNSILMTAAVLGHFVLLCPRPLPTTPLSPVTNLSRLLA
jgi:hypothetical protein